MKFTYIFTSAIFYLTVESSFIPDVLKVQEDEKVKRYDEVKISTQHLISPEHELKIAKVGKYGMYALGAYGAYQGVKGLLSIAGVGHSLETTLAPSVPESTSSFTTDPVTLTVTLANRDIISTIYPKTVSII